MQTQAMSQNDLVVKLKTDFARTQKDTFAKIIQAQQNGERETAYRLAHSLKGLAGLICEDALMEAAKRVETSMSLRGATNEELVALEIELNRVLSSIKPKDTKTNSTLKTLNKEKARCTFDKLVPLLSTRNADALQLINELNEIPGTGEIAEQIESFDFGPALSTLEAVRKKFGV